MDSNPVYSPRKKKSKIGSKESGNRLNLNPLTASKWLSIFFLSLSCYGWGRAAPPVGEVLALAKNVPVPWFTGTLLAPSGTNLSSGDFNFEPYLFANYSSMKYNSDWEKVPDERAVWNLNFVPILQWGLTSWLDITVTPSWFYRITDKAATFSLGDMNALLGFQIYKETENAWYPSIRLLLRESFPMGRFERLDPELDATDAAGTTSFVTGVVLAISRLIHLWDTHWTNLRLAISYNVPAKVKVRGFNAYGGAFDTNGYVYPPQNMQIFFGFEFNFTQRWVFSYDFAASFSEATRFKGNQGISELTGLPADLTKGSACFFSMAPALEYNWGSNLGLISGVWFSFAGRNTEAFTSWVTALNCYY